MRRLRLRLDERRVQETLEDLRRGSRKGFTFRGAGLGKGEGPGGRVTDGGGGRRSLGPATEEERGTQPKWFRVSSPAGRREDCLVDGGVSRGRKRTGVRGKR